MPPNLTIFLAQGRRWLDFFSDREYFSRLFTIAFPIALQTFILNSLNLVGVVMIGQLGETPVAAVGLANQIFFLMSLVLFGVNSGSSMFSAQLWGRKDIASIRKVLALAVFIGLAVSAVFVIIAVAFPQLALGVYSKDPAVVALGSSYLRIFGWAYLFFSITASYSFILRSIGDVRTPLFVTMGALSLNTFLSYVLIFGRLGFPRMEVQGAALASLIARILECAALLWITYRGKSPVAARLREMLAVDLVFAWKVLKPILPVAFNELLWSLGITTYSVVYARIGTDAIAAMNIAASIDSVAIPIFIGIGNACAILVGHLIGAGEERKAHTYAGRSIGLAMVGGLIMGAIIFAASGLILGFYKVSPQVILSARRVITIISLMLWLRMTNLMLFVGVFRSGGDTRFAFFLDGVVIWVVGVPLAFLGAFALHLPVHLVYLMVMAEEVTKFTIGLARYFSRKWIHNLAQIV